jgi:hypothetical protein
MGLVKRRLKDAVLPYPGEGWSNRFRRFLEYERKINDRREALAPTLDRMVETIIEWK